MFMIIALRCHHLIIQHSDSSTYRIFPYCNKGEKDSEHWEFYMEPLTYELLAGLKCSNRFAAIHNAATLVLQLKQVYFHID